MGSAREGRPYEQVSVRYRDNFSRDLLALARYFQKTMMANLKEQCGHGELRLGYAAYIPLIGQQTMRLSDLADAVGVSRQACNQAIRQIEAAGYIATQADPGDGRARQVLLSKRGRQLLEDGVRIAAHVDRHFCDIIGEQAFTETAGSLRLLHRSLLHTPETGEQPPALGGLLPQLSDCVLQRLMQLTMTRGHPDLKLSFGQVLMCIGPRGGRIQHMAAVHDVSKQAISAIATELETLGYIERRPDPEDARQILLYLTSYGHQLIFDSVASLEDMERGFSEILGKRRFRRLQQVFRRLYANLPLEGDYPATEDVQDIGVLARKLRQQLGTEGSRRLAGLLLRPD